MLVGVFVALSKILDWLLAPLSWALLLLALAAVVRRRPRLAWTLAALAAAVLLAFSSGHVATRLERLAGKLVQWGIPPAQVVVEASSRNTRENAIESSRIAAARGWRTLLVVTSAAHAPRALGCFRAVGLEPDLLPVDFRAGDGRGEGWLPRAAVLSRSTDALRELAGRLVYRMVGYAR